MAIIITPPFLFSLALALLLQFNLCTLSFSHSKHSHRHKSSSRVLWLPGGATWYGPADGAGSDGGACGYGEVVGRAPFSSLVAAGAPRLFKSGQGCGACYQVRCTKHKACSGKPVRVVITDECPGGPCLYERFHFDLSGVAIGAMALPGHADQLRAVGILPILFTRVPCQYKGVTLVFHVDAGSNPNSFSVLVEFEDGDGDLASLALSESSSSASSRWRPMYQSWGALWKIDSGRQLHAPFSLRLVSRRTYKILVAPNVIPKAWKPGATYRSLVNFAP